MWPPATTLYRKSSPTRRSCHPRQARETNPGQCLQATPACPQGWGWLGNPAAHPGAISGTPRARIEAVRMSDMSSSNQLGWEADRRNRMVSGRRPPPTLTFLFYAHCILFH